MLSWIYEKWNHIYIDEMILWLYNGKFWKGYVSNGAFTIEKKRIFLLLIMLDA